MKVSKKWMTLLSLPVFSIAMAAEDCKNGVCPVPAPAPGAKQVQNAPKTVADALKHLPATLMEVNGKKITREQAVEKIKAVVPDQYIGQIPQAQLNQMVMGLLDIEIMAALAEKDGYTPNAANVAKMLNEQLAKIPADQKKELENRMKAANKTIESYIKELSENKEVQREVAMQG